MIIGHLPAGYVLSKLGYSRLHHVFGKYRAFVFWGMFGAVAPDLDMFYFHFVYHRSTHHHKYFSHFPSVWLALIVLSAISCFSKPCREKLGGYALLFSVSAFLHLILDSVVGDIWWLSPFVNQPFALATVPAIYSPWWLNFILHWSFLLELAICLWAAWIWKHGPAHQVRRAAPQAVRPMP